MAIIASLKTHDGIVMAADSAVHIYQSVDGEGYKRVKTYGNGQNLFKVNNHRSCILTYGTGNLGTKSVAALINEFMRTKGVNFNEALAVQDVAQILFYTLKEKYDQSWGVTPANERPILGCIVAGFSKTDMVAQEFEFVFPHSLKVKTIKEPHVFGFECRGITDPFERLHKGYDKNLMAEISKKYELSGPEFDNLLGKYESSVIFGGMPTAEGVEYVKHIMLTSVNYGRFDSGEAPGCEPIDMAFITRDKYTTLQAKVTAG